MTTVRIKDQLRPFFTRADVNRGEEYFYDDRTHAVKIGKTWAKGKVFGSESYDVSLDWSSGYSGSISAHCTCPRFGGFHFCKHLWALVMELDYRKFELQDFPTGKINLKVGNGNFADAPEILPAIVQESASNWRSAFKPETNRKRSNYVGPAMDVFMVLDGDHGEDGSIRFKFFASLKEANGTVSGARPLALPPNGDVKSISGKMQIALRAIAMISLGEMNSNQRYSYSFYGDPTYRLIKVESLKLILRDLLETSRVYLNKDDFQKSHETNTDLSLRYTNFGTLKLSVEEKPDGHLLMGKIEADSNELKLDNAGLSIHDLRQLSNSDLFQHGREIGFMELNEAERPWFERLSQGALFVPKGDEEPFLEAILNQQMNFTLPESLKWPATNVSPTSRVDLKLDKNTEQSRYFFDLKFEYGNRTASYWNPQIKLPSDEDKKIYLRDRVEEDRVLSLLPMNLVTTRNSDHANILFATNLVEFVKGAITQGVPVTVENRKVESESSFNFSVSSGLDWFDVDGQASFAGNWVKFPTILEAVSRGERFVPLPDGSLGIITDQISKRLDRLSAFAQKNGESLRFTSAQGILLNSLLEDEANVNLDSKFKELRAKIKRFSGIDATEPAGSFKGKLRKYQREGLGWLHFLENFGLGGILADDMGLGKTIQCLAFLEDRRLSNKRRSPSLLIAPKSLLENWKNEASKFAPELNVLIYAGSLRHEDDISKTKDVDLVVTTYQTMLRDFEALKTIQWDCLVADEAQAIKNPDALISKAAKLIPAKFRLAMTGTPIENSIQDLFSISDFVNPGFLNGKKQSASLKVSDDAREILSKAFKPVVLRRTKDQVLKDLPEKIEQMISVDLEPKQLKIYNELKRFYQAQLLKEVEEKGIKKSQIQILAALTRLRQVALHPGLLSDDHAKMKSSKFEVVLEMLEEIISEDHRVLIFSQFTSLLALLKKELKSRKIDFCYLDGQTTKRQETVDAFKKSDCPVFLMSLKAGGVGLNLVEADYVFLLDPWWNPAVEAQAIDRVHRIGQKKSVNAYRFIAKNTVEEKILELQNTKRGLSADVLGNKSGPIKSLTAKDIEHIFS